MPKRRLDFLFGEEIRQDDVEVTNRQKPVRIPWGRLLDGEIRPEVKSRVHQNRHLLASTSDTRPSRVADGEERGRDRHSVGLALLQYSLGPVLWI